MRPFNFSIIILIVLLLSIPAFSGQQRAKLPQSAYLKSAKIALNDREPRLEEAMMMLDSMIFYYGAAPEAYFFRGSIYAEYAAKATDLKKKIEQFTIMSANYDSVLASCSNPDVKKDLKKDCKRLTDLLDSVRVKYWAENYNEGVKNIERLDKEYAPKVKEATDSAGILAAKEEMKIVADSGKHFFMIAAAVDPKDYRAYEGVGLVYDRMKDLDSSIIWFQKAFEHSPDTTSHIVQNIAYAHIQKNDYKQAIEYFKKYLKFAPTDGNTLFNIAICYSNMQENDSAFKYDLMAMAADSTIAGAYIDAGQYFLIKSQKYSDSIKSFTQQDKGQEAKRCTENRDNLLDSSSAFFAVAARLEPDNVMIMEQYGVAKLVAGHYTEASEIFKKLTELEPFRKDNWVSLGDIYVQEQKFAEAILPYEKAVEIDPGDSEIWKVLRDIYQNLSMPDKAKKAEEKLEELKKL